MSSDDTSRPDAYGVHLHWVDALGQEQQISPATARLLHSVIGEPPADLEQRAPIVTRPGRDPGLGSVQVLCEDGSGQEFVHGLTRDGVIFPFALNSADLTDGTAGKAVTPRDYTGSEWAGATFEPKNGSWLFANLQSPGITFAITGPWRKGAL